ncbi:MAG: DUF2178 domain-containing protein [Halobacterium sp.]
MYAAVGAGVLGFLAGVELDYPLVGLGVYWLGIGAFLAVWKGTSVELYDERDHELERRASLTTLQIAGVAVLAALTGMVVVEEATTNEVPTLVVGGFLALSALFLLYGAVCVVYRYRR